MKIKSFVLVVVLAIAILGFGFTVNAQTTSVKTLIAQLQTLIAQLQAQIASLMSQLKTLQAQQQNNSTNTTPQTELVYDADSGIYMEQNVLNKINTIRTITGVCGDCNNLPQPTISLNNGTLPAVYNLYLNNKKVTQFPLPSLNALNTIVDNAGNTLSVTYRTFVNGTNSIKFLIPSAGNYFQNENIILTPNQTANVNYKIIKKQGQYGSAYFFILDNDSTINLDKIISDFDSIAKKESALANLTTVDPYYIIAMPHMFALSLGGEGNFYMGQHLVTINYGGNLYYQANPQIFNNELAHEYTHGLQETLSLDQKYTGASFLMEGMADAVAIYTGFRNWSDFGLGGQISPGCSNFSRSTDFVHDFGRCIFKHLSQSNYLNSSFFSKLFNPTQTFDLSKCSYNNPSTSTILQNQDCADQINKLLSYLTGQDMTQFMKNELLANVSTSTCNPNWTCGGWSNCANGTQMRVCSDSNNCGINIGKPAESQSCVYSCNDTDSGIDYNNYGVVTFGGNSYSDWCSTNGGNGGQVSSCSGSNCTLIEQYCDSSIGGVNYKSYICPNGCTKGACNANQTVTCTDSDGGENYYIKGTLTGIYNGAPISLDDFCIDRTNGAVVDQCSGTNCQVGERVCNSSNPADYGTKYYICSNGCSNGACVQQSSLNTTQNSLASISASLSKILKQILQMLVK